MRHNEVAVAELSGLTVVTDEPITGLADALARQPDTSPEEQARILSEAIAAQGVAPPVDRGQSLVRSIVDRLMRRTPSSELGPFDVPTPWLSFHVPPGGTGHLRLANKSDLQHGLNLKAVGSGWGAGRQLTIGIDRDFHERTRCLKLSLALNTRVTLYQDSSPPRADVLGISGLLVEELGECPDCSGENERRGAMVVAAGEWIDLRSDPLGQTVATTIDLVDRSALELSVPFSVPGTDVQIGIEWSRRTQLTCSCQYVFPGGRRYRPSARYGEPPDLAFWRWD